MLKKLINSYSDIIILSLISVPVGIVVGLTCAIFGRTLLWITDIRSEHAYLFIPFLGMVGAAIIMFYNKFGSQVSSGMSLIFKTGHGENDKIPLRLIPFIIVATWLTHLFGGSAGREGVAIQVGGTIAHKLGRHLPMKNSGKILLIVGMAAGFAGLFRTPFAATFFAMELLTVGVLEHKAILPALTASFTAGYVSGLAGLEKFSFMLTDSIAFSWELVPKIILLGVIFGIAGGLFSMCLSKTKKFLSQRVENPVTRILVVGIIVSILSLLCLGGRYSGLGTNLISMSFGEGIYTWDFALKFIFTVLTLSAGFQGGEVTPLFSIGASLGVVLAAILGLPVPFVAALGYVAVFGSATNTLIAPMLIGAEVFGFANLPYFIVVCTIAHVFHGTESIYPLQRRLD